jgi:integrase/recombinase XerD
VTNGKSAVDVTDADAVAYRKFLDDSEYSPNSRVIGWKAVRSYYTWLHASGRISLNPFVSIKGPKRILDERPRVASDEQVGRLLNAIKPETPNEYRERACLFLCANGLRVSEVAGLRRTDYQTDGDARMVTVTGKGGRMRVVPLNASVAMALDEWLDCAIESSEWLLHFADGSPITERMVRSAVNKAIDLCYRQDKQHLGVAAERFDISAHSLRHNYATRLIRAGANLFSVQKLLGHSSITTTQIYVNLDTRDIINAANLDTL